jgi:hypothetical protein
VKDGTVQQSRLHVLTIDELATLGRHLAAVAAAPDDVVLVLPTDGTLIQASSDELIEACVGFGGDICVGASPVPLSSTSVAAKMADAVARATGWSPVRRATGWRPARAYPYPYALLGPAHALRDLAALFRVPTDQTDADVIAMTLLEGSHQLVLDTATQVFHVLDGTGTDVVAVAERAYSGGEQPLVVVDPHPGTPALARLHEDLADTGSRDLAGLLRYDGAVDAEEEVDVPAAEILLTRFWTVGFCSTIIRAAEATGAWMASPEGPGLRSEVQLQVLSPRLLALLDADLDARIWPLVVGRWPSMMTGGLEEAVVVRHEAGQALAGLDTTKDLGHVGAAVRLNNGYSGGGLFFPRQHWDNREAGVGSLVIWPSAFTHPYRPESVSRGVEYLLILHWEAPPDFTDDL